ncbi:MAG: hypothetical protein K6F85_07540 [Bacteroidales bacterium]|nr:hypothetical protein [Bacteroidales bacterium]
MQNSKNQDIILAGSHLAVPRDIVIIRLRNYYRRYGKTLEQLKIDDRRQASLVLADCYGCTTKEIASIFGVTMRQIQYDINYARFQFGRSGLYRRQVDRIDSYILYNAKYFR